MADPTNPSDLPAEYFQRGQQPAAPSNYADLSRKDIATDVYTAFRNSGFSDVQARALTAEINRENSFRPEFIFGTHNDPANSAENVGMMSWQGSRAPEVMGFLAEHGLLDENGEITPGFDAIQAQADFIKYEMENNPEYKQTNEQFLKKPGVDPQTAHRILGDNYIRWRRTDPEYSGSGYAAINEGYDVLTGDAADFSTRTGVRPQARPEDLAQADNKSYLDYLSKALPYMEAAQLTGAPKAKFDPPGVRRPQAGSGTRALKQFGLASLA